MIAGSGKIAGGGLDSVFRMLNWRLAARPTTLNIIKTNTHYIPPTTEPQTFATLTNTSPLVGSGSHIRDGFFIKASAKDGDNRVIKVGPLEINIPDKTQEFMGHVDTQDERDALFDHLLQMQFESDYDTARKEIARRIATETSDQMTGQEMLRSVNDLLVDEEFAKGSSIFALVSLAIGTDTTAMTARKIFAAYCMEHADENVIGMLREKSSIVIFDDTLADAEDEEDLDSALKHICVWMDADTISNYAAWILLHFYNENHTARLEKFFGDDYRTLREMTDFLSQH